MLNSTNILLSVCAMGVVATGIFLLRNPDGQGQPFAKELSGPYLISSWAVWQLQPSDAKGGPLPNKIERGAYIIDSKTGDLFEVQNDGKPKHLGSVKKTD